MFTVLGFIPIILLPPHPQPSPFLRREERREKERIFVAWGNLKNTVLIILPLEWRRERYIEYGYAQVFIMFGGRM